LEPEEEAAALLLFLGLPARDPRQGEGVLQRVGLVGVGQRALEQRACAGARRPLKSYTRGATLL
jgi:hypothetical protein